MTAKGARTAARIRGLAVALIANAAALAMLSIGPQPTLHLQPEAPSNIVTLDLFRPRPPKAVEAERKPEATPAAQVRPPAAVKPSSAQAAPAPAPAVLQAPPAQGAPAAPPAAALGQGAASDKGAAAVRHLLGCAAFAAGRRRDGEGCEPGRGGEPGHIDALTPERRLGLGLSGPMRRDELVETNRELQTQTFQPQGSRAARFGCNLKDGKWKCSTY